MGYKQYLHIHYTFSYYRALLSQKKDYSKLDATIASYFVKIQAVRFPKNKSDVCMY